jgi:hypothetical protein
MVEETAGRISSVMTLGSPTGQREIVLRVATMNPGPAVKALEAAGYAVKGSRRG